MWCVILMTIVAAVYGQQTYRYDGTVVDNSRPSISQRPSFVFSPPQRPVPVSFQPPRPVQQNPVFIPQRVQNTFIPTPESSQFIQIPSDLVCNPNGIVDSFYGTEAFHFSWCHDGGQTYTFQQSQEYCAGLEGNFTPMSVETPDKQSYLESVLEANYVYYIWTSGNRLSSKRWSWSNGASSSYTNWAPTGSLGLPQPDNASGDERCLAVHMADWAAWHDHSCTFRFPVVCQIPAYNQ